MTSAPVTFGVLPTTVFPPTPTSSSLIRKPAKDVAQASVKQLWSKTPQSVATSHVPLILSVPSAEQVESVSFRANVALLLVTEAGEVSRIMKNQARNKIKARRINAPKDIIFNLFLFGGVSSVICLEIFLSF
jgi:hypothetical protein